MNGQERVTLEVVATDIKWLIEECKEINISLKEHTKQQKITNGQVQKNTTFRKVATWMGSISFLTLMGLCIKILTTGSVT